MRKSGGEGFFSPSNENTAFNHQMGGTTNNNPGFKSPFAFNSGAKSSSKDADDSGAAISTKLSFSSSSKSKIVEQHSSTSSLFSNSNNSMLPPSTSLMTTSNKKHPAANMQQGNQMKNEMMPPSSSLFDNHKVINTTSFNTPTPASASLDRSAMRQRHASSRVGIDLGSARGLNLTSPVFQTPLRKSIQPQRKEEYSSNDAGVTAAIEVIKVTSPWITVFGYPTGYGDTILRHFQKFGEVCQHKSEPGNWMHLKYASQVQATRALAQNGQFINIGSGTFMIGVKPCSDIDADSSTSIKSSALKRKRSKMTDLSSSYKFKDYNQSQPGPKRALSICSRFVYWLIGADN